MRLGVHANPNKPAALELAARAVAALAERAELVVSDELPSLAPELPHRSLGAMDVPVLVAIGGDGTFLHALRRCPAALLPLNAGTVGVLSEVDARRPAELSAALENVLAGRYFLEERLKLAGEVDGTALPDATNEHVVHAARVGKTSIFEIALDGVPTGRMRADGLIVSTPTGSTAYALSSLGPIVEPTVDALVLTSIAPFRADKRAVVLDPLRTVRVTVVRGAADGVVLSDGEGEQPLPAGTSATFFRSPRNAVFVRFGASFVERLRGKRILPWTEEVRGAGDADLSTPP